MDTHYEIRDATGMHVATHMRVDEPGGTKRMYWQQPSGQPGLGGAPVRDLPLFGSERLGDWPSDTPVVVTEGEKAAAALMAAGINAVGSVTGASSIPGPQALAELNGRTVLLWPDNDDAGRDHMLRIAAALAGVANGVRWIEWPDAPPKGDAADFVETHGIEDLDGLIARAGPVPIAPPRRLNTDMAHIAPPWPEPIGAAALTGFVGEAVREIEPFTEADPAALVAHLLAGIGAMAGPNVHAVADHAEHPPRLFAVIVGETSHGRKGTAAAAIKGLLFRAEPNFRDRTLEALSSGEGLIWAVRDPIEKLQRTGRGEGRRTERVIEDAGVTDKRLHVIESEFASTLRVAQREGNNLTAIVRRAWESGDLATLTKNSPAKATGAHVVIVGHVTRDELLRYLDRTELASGFANRFLWIAARRGHLLPDGEGVPDEVSDRLAREIMGIVDWATTPRLLRRDDEAAERWRQLYPDLATGRPGLLGAATGRAEAQVLRLSVMYAILDRSELITLPHLEAAAAVWDYAERSASWIFGDAVGDPLADDVLGFLRRSGSASRNDIYEMLGRHTRRERIEGALRLLERGGLATQSFERDTGGRPREVWTARLLRAA